MHLVFDSKDKFKNLSILSLEKVFVSIGLFSPVVRRPSFHIHASWHLPPPEQSLSNVLKASTAHYVWRKDDLSTAGMLQGLQRK